MNSTNNRLRKHKSSMCLQCRQWKFTHLFCSRCECVCLYLSEVWLGLQWLIHLFYIMCLQCTWYFMCLQCTWWRFTVHMMEVYSSLWTFSAGHAVHPVAYSFLLHCVFAVHIVKVYSFLWTFSVHPVKLCDSCSCNNGLFCIWWQFLCSFPWILNL